LLVYNRECPTKNSSTISPTKTN